jgi:hypothetical protein
MGFNSAFKGLRKIEVHGLSPVFWSWWQIPETFFTAY